MEKHVNIVAALHIAFSIIGILVGFIGFLVLNVVGDFAMDHDAKSILAIIANVAIIFFTIVSIPGLIAGIGLLKRKEWARILAMIIGALDLLSFPFGTALGVYTIWAMANSETVEIFKKS